ncbi:hypothetical protein cypCar_00012496, partial [Cyprinus carpio]
MFLLSGSGFLSRFCSRLSKSRLLKEGTRNTETRGWWKRIHNEHLAGRGEYRQPGLSSRGLTWAPSCSLYIKKQGPKTEDCMGDLYKTRKFAL